LGLAGGLCLLDNGAELLVTGSRGRVEGVEEEGHGSGEHTLNLLDFVAGLDQVGDGVDNWESGSTRGFVVEVAAGCVTALTGGREDVIPEFEGVADALLVWSDNMDAG
jgi:hypothetical protein